MRQLIAQGFGRDHLGAARHRLGGQFWHQVAEIGIARDDDEFGAHLALGRVHHRVGTALDAHRRRLFVDRTAQRLDGRRFAQRQVQRVDVAATHVEHTAHVLLAIHHFADAILIHQLELRVTVALPQTLLRLQVTHLLGRHRRKHTAVLQVTLNIVFGDPLTNDAPTFERHLPQQLRLLAADRTLDHVDVTAVAVDDLATVATRCTETDLGRFQHCDLEATLQEKQGRG
ncbi:hypothetical protein D3C73_1059640 [compost metagenome]